MKVRIGFVGCGGIAEAHMKGLVKREDVEITAFCDVNEERAGRMAERYGAKGARVFADAKEMFKTVELDAAYFCLPPHAHGSELYAVEAGVPFFVEKPINLYLSQAQEILAAVKERGMITSVGYMNRYRKGVQTVRELLRDDPPILVLGGWIGGTPRAREGIWSWWIVKEKSGGQFHEQVTHTVDLVRFICGEVEEVHAYVAKGLNVGAPEGYSIEDAWVVNMKLKGGGVANLWASCSANAGGGGVTLSIYANRTTALFSGWEHSLRLLRAGEEERRIPGEPNIFEIEDAAFVEAVKKGDPSSIACDYEDGFKTMKVTLAACESAEKGEPVPVG